MLRPLVVDSTASDATVTAIWLRIDVVSMIVWRRSKGCKSRGTTIALPGGSVLLSKLSQETSTLRAEPSGSTTKILLSSENWA